MTFGSFVKPFLEITQGELDPQFASKGSYFEQNIKKVCRCNWEVKKHTWELYLIYIIIHVPLQKILKHLGQFGGLDIKTSQEPKLRKFGKLGIFKKFQKGEITRNIINIISIHFNPRKEFFISIQGHTNHNSNKLLYHLRYHFP